ncbi:MAG: hypothetical protein N0A16_05380 [Blastocatellia bacterium]|nr:hypothetical protein [Blastocatellia bacterium]MCS7157141.1 hypothetical protein [Blastocatellia bacterium]MDW8167279.1 DUF4175 family protein [Acidobacteriota bacterium]
MTMPSSEMLLQFVHRLRRRWLWGYWLRQAALAGSALVGWFTFAGLMAARVPVAPEVLTTLRVATAFVVLGIVYAFVWRPLRRIPDEVTFARFIEEREPLLEDRLVTAIEILSRSGAAVAGASIAASARSSEPVQGFSPALVHRLLADALAQCSMVREESVLSTRRLRLRALLAVAPLALFAMLLAIGPEALRIGLGRLYVPGGIAVAPDPAIRVYPGDARIPRGLDQVVTATLQNFEADSARIVFRSEGESNWQEQPMEASEPRTFRFLFANVQRSIEYYVTARAIHSPTFRLEVVDWPRVSRLELLYVYPAYTGQPSHKVEDGGDIAALKGTRVTVTAQLNGRVREAQLVFDDGSTLAMAPSGTSSSFTASFIISKNARYHVRVQPLAGEAYAASREYSIEALEDAPPTIAIEKPGRDMKVTAIQEVFTEARAEDDYGIARVELRYSVNGGPEQTVTLYQSRGTPSRSITGSHTFFLEEWNLQPGDVVSYYVTARDNNTATGPGVATSDIYFLEVRPFDRRFRQAQQTPTGQGMGERESAFAERQKEIIAATWRVLREKDRVSAEEFRENVNTLELAQSKLREDVQTVVDRMRRRLGEGLEEMEDFKKLFDALSAAVGEMGRAIEELRARRLKEALPFEQRAYQQLLRADAIFREIQVAFADRGQNGGNARAQDLADLFELELDKMKNQYETIQRDRGQARDRQLEELERRLRELAERQQRLLEQRLRQGASGGGSGDDGQMAEQVRELARQLERLTRERRDARLEQVRQQLERAAREMQRARSASDGREATAHRAQALEHLQAARRQLQSAQRSQLAEEIRRLRDRAREAREHQERIAREVERLARESDRAPLEAARPSLRDRKSALAEEVSRLRQQIEDAARRARQENDAAAARGLSAAAETIQRERVPEQIEQGIQLLENRWLEYAAERERAIARALGEVARRLDEAARNAGSRSPDERLAEAQERARRLAENLQSLSDRLSAERGNARPRGEESRGESRASAQGTSRAGDQRGRADRSGERASATPESSREPSGGQRTGEVRVNPLGSRGPARDSTADATAFGRPSPSQGRDLGEALRQLRRELDERVEEAEELRRLMPLRDLVDDVNRIIAELRRLDEARLFHDPEEIERLKRQVLDPLRRLEWELSRRQQERLGADRLRLAEEMAVPPEYRRLVEEYYRRLARQPK